ncbi:uncharacterized protein [Nicotiana tomentosiformis]|uniref:uncharacterized protein n=1 Tax=Nicotiana tomentosiformis TaxID=4098 RepID=UPI00051C3C7F|nr:uncharacterized protein LOC117276290 [Nicotiana tomentosiformis]
MSTASGGFTVTTAWEILRHRAHVNAEYKLLWTKGLPFKISFFLWRLWKGKIPTDDLWRRNDYMVVSKCWCCDQPQEDSYQHLFLLNPTANRVWRTFVQAAGSPCSDHLGNLLEEKHKEVWRYSFVQHGYKPYVMTKRITWEPPYEEWFKCNINGALKGNPGSSSYDFCMRNSGGDLVHAKAERIGESTNIVAEAKAIVEGFTGDEENHRGRLGNSMVYRKGGEEDKDNEGAIQCTMTFNSFTDLPSGRGRILILD